MMTVPTLALSSIIIILFFFLLFFPSKIRCSDSVVLNTHEKLTSYIFKIESPLLGSDEYINATYTLTVAVTSNSTLTYAQYTAITGKVVIFSCYDGGHYLYKGDSLHFGDADGVIDMILFCPDSCDYGASLVEEVYLRVHDFTLHEDLFKFCDASLNALKSSSYVKLRKFETDVHRRLQRIHKE